MSAGIDLLLKVGNGVEIAATDAALVVQDLTYTAVAGQGYQGNDIAIEYLDTETAGAETVTVTETLGKKLISVGMESGVSTATQIETAIDASTEALALVSVAVTGTGSNAQTAVAETFLSGGAPLTETFTTVGGLRTKSLSMNSEMIDITNHGSQEWREILDGKGLRSMSSSGGGVFLKGAQLNRLKYAHLENALIRMQLIHAVTGDIFEGKFKVSSMELTGDHNTEASYSASLESAEKVNFKIAKVA